MIDISKAKWELTDSDLYAIEWLKNHGFDVVLEKQYLSKTKYRVKKNGVADRLYIPKGFNYDIKSYMSQYENQFDLLCKLNEIKKDGKEK